MNENIDNDLVNPESDEAFRAAVGRAIASIPCRKSKPSEDRLVTGTGCKPPTGVFGNLDVPCRKCGQPLYWGEHAWFDCANPPGVCRLCDHDKYKAIAASKAEADEPKQETWHDRPGLL